MPVLSEVEDADGFVLEGEVMMRLGGDFDFGSCGLRGQEGCDQAEKEGVSLHAGIVAPTELRALPGRSEAKTRAMSKGGGQPCALYTDGSRVRRIHSSI